MITEAEYSKAVSVVRQYHEQVDRYCRREAKGEARTETHATLESIYDYRHGYEYLDCGTKYSIRKWYPARYRHGRMIDDEYFSIWAGGKARKYRVNSHALAWNLTTEKP